ncbi:MAG: mercuric transporter MerT family protein [Planctomycetota bacterium]
MRPHHFGFEMGRLHEREGLRKQTEAETLCPSCGCKGRAVMPVTIESLVVDVARARAGQTDGFRFCAEPSCDVAYFGPESGERVLRSEVKVRIGQKETEAPRPVCYCFEHTVEEVEEEVARTGTSVIPDEITAKCRQGLDRCEETNPQGACCLGNVLRAVKEAQAKTNQNAPVAVATNQTSNDPEEDCCAMNAKNPSTPASRLDAGLIAQFGALASAVVASACCWLPLLLIAVGVSGGAMAATFEAWRPVLLPVTFALLGVAFYFTYRKPKAATAGAGEACCAVPAVDSGVASCCPPENAKGFTIKKVNKVMLWVVTAFVLAFALFPYYVGYFLTGGNVPVNRGNLAGQANWMLAIEGMTCEGCAKGLQSALMKLPGVTKASVSYSDRRAVIETDVSVTEKILRQAVSSTGFSVNRCEIVVLP